MNLQVIDKNAKPVKTTFNKPFTKHLQCKCGLIVKTRSIEYFCPLCRTELVQSTSTGNNLSHIALSWHKHYDLLKEKRLKEELDKTKED